MISGLEIKAMLLAVMVAVVGGISWALKHEIERNGEITAEYAQQVQKTAEANRAVKSLQSEMEVRDATIMAFQQQRDALEKRAEKARVVVQTVYRDPAVRPWAEEHPPAAVVAAAGAAIGCLWKHTAVPGAADCEDRPAAGPDAGLRPAASGVDNQR